MKLHLNRSQLRWTVALLAIFTTIGLLLFAYRTLDDLANGRLGTWPRRLIEEGTGAYAALLLAPLVVWVAHTFPMRRGRWAWSSLAWLGGAAVYSLAHTSLLALVRPVLFHLFGLGSYDYGIMRLRYPMEAGNDFIAFTAFAVIVTFVGRMEAARRAELESAELQGKLARARLENLQLQLQPHFLFNTLNAVSSIMYEDVGRADAMLAKLADFLRRVLASGGADDVTLEEELDAERAYVEIMDARLERGLQLTVHVAEGARTARIPFLLLQPLLENSIRHGANGTAAALTLDIDVVARDGGLQIVVCDDGCGIDPAFAPGIGLQNVRERLAYAYGSAASFTIEPRRDVRGTIATIALPPRERKPK